ncbi:hypothetical protein Athai_02620 [Actinocatenispora thailandica]|uniref:ROK family protein n=1 Tax=Actinocatenispora thailandica TaxID=227318 RepID=A0A7R7DJC2_9ACTN|nr:hypothetical protein Athai_02620 [Actinocatenispora thailandica]
MTQHSAGADQPGRDAAGTGGAEVAVAIDVGGTAMKCALVDGSGQVRHTERHDTNRDRGPDAVVATIGDVAAGLADTARAQGLSPARWGWSSRAWSTRCAGSPGTRRTSAGRTCRSGN